MQCITLTKSQISFSKFWFFQLLVTYWNRITKMCVFRTKWYEILLFHHRHGREHIFARLSQLERVVWKTQNKYRMMHIVYCKSNRQMFSMHDYTLYNANYIWIQDIWFFALFISPQIVSLHHLETFLVVCSIQRNALVY